MQLCIINLLCGLNFRMENGSRVVTGLMSSPLKKCFRAVEVIGMAERVNAV